MQRLNPLNDVAFTKSFGEKGCEKQLISLLNAILQRTGRNTITSVDIIPHKTLLPETFSGKTSILDVHAGTADGRRFIVEIQRQNEYNIERRTLFGWAKEYVRGIHAGQDYSELPDVVAINILDFTNLEAEDFHTSFHLWEDRERGLKLTDAVEIHFIEMPKFRKLAEKDLKDNRLHRWLSYLDEETPAKILEEIMLTDPVIEEAKKMMDVIEQDDALYHSYTLYQMTLMRELNVKRGARIEGQKEGRKEAFIEVARKMKDLGEEAEKITAVTGLSAEEIGEL